MNFSDYLKTKNEIINMLDKIKNNIIEKKLKDEIEEKINHFKEDRFIISIFGHFSNGKSTFLNSLMGFGEEILKEDDAASTATITRLKYANDETKINKAEIIYFNNESQWVSIEELKNYVARNEEIEVETIIKEVIVYLDSEYLKNGVEIVDTPGFNSTYQLHTEIALRQVEQSDAAIFMFSYDKPGSYEEFKFLKCIEKYMNKVFFLLNKVDLYDTTENTIEKTKEDIFRKMKEMKIDIVGKTIYPISARLAKEAIKENSIDKMNSSNMQEFMNVLAKYLTSEENIHDRIDAPLKSLVSTLEIEKNSIDECIFVCNEDKSAIKKEVEKKKEKIKEMEKELRDKRVNIRRSVYSEITEGKREVEKATIKIIDDAKKTLENINSQFSINLVNFENITKRIFDSFIKEWGNVSINLEDKLINIVSESIDDYDDCIKVENNIRKVIKTSLQFDKIDVESPRKEYEELKKFDDDIKKAKDERNRISKELESLYTKQTERDQLLEKKQCKNNEIDRLIQNKERKIEQLSSIQSHWGKKTVQKEEKRDGFLGKFITKFIGDKKIEVEEEFCDDTEKKKAEDNIDKINKEIENLRNESNKEIEELDGKIKNLGAIDYRINSLEKDEEIQNKFYFENMLNYQEKKLHMEEQVIKFEKENYIKNLENELCEHSERINLFLESSKDKFISIINDVLEIDSKKIEIEKRGLENIISFNNKTPKEIEIELKQLYQKKEIIENAIMDIKNKRSMN